MTVEMSTAGAGSGAADGAAHSGVPGCLDGCSVFVTVTHSGGLNASAAFGTKVGAMGANVAKMLSKTVTHVVFKGDDAELRSLYERASKVSPACPAQIVGLGWVLACEREQRRALERPYICPKPAATPRFLGTPPGGSAGGGAKRKARSMAPKAADNYDVDLDFFSSSQALKDEAEGIPRGSSAKKRSASARKAAQTSTSGRKRARTNAATTPGSDELPSGGARRSRLRKSLSLPASTVTKKSQVRAGEDGSGLGGSGGKATVGCTAEEATPTPGAANDNDKDADATDRDHPASPIRPLHLPHRTPGPSTSASADACAMPPPPPVPIDLLGGDLGEEGGRAGGQTIPGGRSGTDGGGCEAGAGSVRTEGAATATGTRTAAGRSPLGERAVPTAAALDNERNKTPPPGFSAGKTEKTDASAPAEKTGLITVSAAGHEMMKLVEGVAKRLPGMRVASAFEADRATHLVLAEPKRTMKLLRAVTRGAWVVTAEWITASATAGRWVDEAPYETTRFPGARRAREAIATTGAVAGTGSAGATAVGGKSALLSGVKVCVQERSAPPSAAELKALVTAAGGEVTPRARGAAVIIAPGARGGASSRRGAAGAAGTAGGGDGTGGEVVKETWLMQAIADYAVPAFEAFRP